MTKATDATPRGARRSWFLPLLTVLALALAGAVLLWRGARGGVTIAARSPAANEQDVSGLATIRVRFDQEMDTTSLPDLRLTPDISAAASLSHTVPLTGFTRWEDERTLTWRPSLALLPETRYTVELPTGLQSAAGESLPRAVRWRFTTRPLQVLALGWDAQERVQLYRYDLQGGQPRALMAAEQGVVDYAIAPGGTSVVYSSLRADGGSDLWQLALGSERADEAALLLDCGGDYCVGPVWTPDGARLLYERRRIGTPGETPDPPRLWWLAPGSGQTTPLFSDEQLLGHAPRFSADGSWMAFVVPLVQATQLYNFESGDLIATGNEIGEPVAWHPWRNSFLMNNIQYQGESFSVYLFQMEMADARLVNVSGDLVTNDASPAWSPDGQWIVFGRRLPRTPQGRQLWLMRPDSGESMALTEDFESNFGLPSWSPDGRQILVQRFRVTEPDSDPGIWVVDVDDGELHEVAQAGFLPAWLP